MKRYQKIIWITLGVLSVVFLLFAFSKDTHAASHSIQWGIFSADGNPSWSHFGRMDIARKSNGVWGFFPDNLPQGYQFGNPMTNTYTIDGVRFWPGANNQMPGLNGIATGNIIGFTAELAVYFVRGNQTLWRVYENISSQPWGAAYYNKSGQQVFPISENMSNITHIVYAPEADRIIVSGTVVFDHNVNLGGMAFRFGVMDTDPAGYLYTRGTSSNNDLIQFPWIKVTFNITETAPGADPTDAINQMAQLLAQQQQQIINMQNQTNINIQNQTNQDKEYYDREKQGEDNIENQSNPDIGDDSQATNLIGYISGFVGAVLNISPTNCDLNGDMGYINIGVINLCSGGLPTIVPIITSAVAIGIFIPYAYFMIKRIISEIRSFSG